MRNFRRCERGVRWLYGAVLRCNVKKFQFRIGSLFILTIAVGVAITIWSQYHPRHGVYSQNEMESLLVDGMSFAKLANGSMVELKQVAMKETYWSVRVVKSGSDSYSELPIDKAMRLLAILDKFDMPSTLADPSSEILFLPVGEFEIQYIVKKHGVLQMPISIDIVDDSSLLVGYDFVTTTDLEAKKTISSLQKLVKKISDANPHGK